MRINANGISINYQIDGPERAPWLVLSNSLLTNLAMWDDQVAALQWIKRNISKFGGDPAKVIISGQSAGAGSVSLLQASPLAKGNATSDAADEARSRPGDSTGFAGRL